MDRRYGLYRLLIGAAQGLALYLLSKAFSAHTDNIWIAGGFCAALLTPAVLLAEVSRMPLRWLAGWFVVAALVLGLLGVWGVWRSGPPSPYETTAILRLGFALPGGAILLFISHHLVSVGLEARRWIAPYPAYFDAAWRHALQVALSALFLSIFWAVLYLGAFLFVLIGRKFLLDLIQHDWFGIPISAVVFAGAVHLTDVRIALIRGFRTMVLTLFAVLLPLVAGLSALFLAVGAVTGMKGVWTAQSAAASLLGMALAMIVFLNAAYQDGAEERRPGVVLRWTMRAAPFLIVALSLLSSNTVVVLVLRHGWTPERIVAAAASLVLFVHGAGYIWAVLSKGRFMARLELTNVLTAHLSLFIGLLLLSPIGDPARISVDSQVKALLSGRIAPAKFDYQFLAGRSARFGEEALATLKKSANPEIASRAKQVRSVRLTATPVTPSDRLAHIHVYPAGTRLPAGILELSDQKNWNPNLPDCFLGITDCAAYVMDLNKDRRPDVLFTQNSRISAVLSSPSGWQVRAAVTSNVVCVDSAVLEQSLRSGQVRTTPADEEDIMVGSTRFRLSSPVCNSAPPLTSGTVVSSEIQVGSGPPPSK